MTDYRPSINPETGRCCMTPVAGSDALSSDTVEPLVGRRRGWRCPKCNTRNQRDAFYGCWYCGHKPHANGGVDRPTMAGKEAGQ